MADAPSNPGVDATLVTAINRVFYESEAASYDHRHPEVMKGDRSWWQKVGGEVLDGPRPRGGLNLLDVGSGTGMVMESLAEFLRPGDRFHSIELSPSMLARTRAKWAGRAIAFQPVYINGQAGELPFANASMDLVTMNALLHHLFDPGALLAEVDRVLKPGGRVFMCHEPNKRFFQSPLLRGLATLYKVAGGGIETPGADICQRVNRELTAQGLIRQPLTEEEIHRLVEYHSPVERHRYGVSADAGFDPDELARSHFPAYRVVEVDEFTTFFHRPSLERHPWVGRSLEFLWQLLLRHGNHFRLALAKPGGLPA
ncbi:MAG: class I SAM-dependent methyltransferase [Magnetococcales bacterium]|nr:class I SAM-dependent methyltransferase [Magnetococcales bacterium]